MISVDKSRELVQRLVSHVLKSIDPYEKTLEKLKDVKRPYRKVYMVAFGKSSLKMAKATIDSFDIERGVVVTNEDVSENKNPTIEYIQGGHPFPNEKSLEAAERAIEILRKAREDDLVLVMISGGGSALFEYPKVELETLRNITKSLMESGASIDELNVVRKALSFVKGGKLPNFTRASMISFVMSDVVGDDLKTIASGPTFYQDVHPEDAFKIFEKYGIGISLTVKNAIKSDENIQSRKPVEHVIVASNRDACTAARDFMSYEGYRTLYLGSAIQGESREVAKALGGIYKEIESRHTEFTPPIAVISGGETTVTVKGNGMGGRNQEMALSIVPIIAKKKILFVSFGTDGIDGHSSAAGAIADGTSMERAQNVGMDYRQFLNENDSFHFFERLDDLIVTGFTGTNVMDVHVALIS